MQIENQAETNSRQQTRQAKKLDEKSDARSHASTPATGTAVFVGRASFRMIAPVVAVGEDGIEMATPAPVPAQPDARWFAPSERVVLHPPESVTRAMPLDATLEQPLMDTLAVPGKITEKIAEKTARTSINASSAPVSLRWWAVAAALVVGATATLSAQAVMRKRGRVTTVVAQHSTQEAAPEATAAAAATLPVPAVPAEAEGPNLVASAPAATALQATVVQSTATLPGAVAAPEATQDEPGARLIAVSTRPRSNRTVARATARPPAEGRAAKAPSSAAVAGRWVDPFAGETIPGFVPRAAGTVKAKPGLAKGSQTGTSASGSTTASNSTWVDPFVN